MSRNTPWRTTRKMFALHQPGVNDWYRIKNQIDGPTQVHIYDEIGYFGVSAADFIRDLANVDGPIEVHVNSPGGEVFDGIAIYNALLARKDVTVMIDGIAASIASVIAMAGNPVLIARNAQMMIHDGFGQAIGNAQDLRDLAELLDRTSNNIAGIYSDHTGKPATYWREIMKGEAWFDADEAIEAGLADRMIDNGAGRKVQTDKWDMSVFQIPTGRMQNAASVAPNQVQHAPMAGTHVHLHHAHGSNEPPEEDGMHLHMHRHNGDNSHDHHYSWDPDGDGDNDATPSGDLNHSHWSETGQQLKSVPGRPLTAQLDLIDIQNASVDNSPWDAGKAMHNASQSDNPASFYAAICAGKRAGDADSQEAHALPHHYHPGDAPNAAGVRAALGRLSQTQGLTNESAARSHLEAHMRTINPDWKPSDSLENPFGLTQAEMRAFSDSIKL